ncbi:MAG: glycoside hydrolase family 2 protein [Bacilli bacterium]|nr:glycoside hydrolase family 2 protein [Bacilli bacterium]
MREVLHLNYDWDYLPNFADEYLEMVDFSHSIKVDLPHTVKEIPYNYFDENIYQFISCYHKTLNLPKKYIDNQLLLKFDGVMSYCEVYLNGTFISKHYGGYTPFSVDITPYFRFGEDNHLIVKVDSNERNDIPPFGFVMDYLAYGGIYREVRLEIVPKTHIDNLFIKTKQVTDFNKQLEIKIVLNEPINDNYYKLNIKVLDADNIIKVINQPLYINTQEIYIKEELSDVKLWDLDNPNLYHLIVELLHNDVIIDKVNERFGFREILFKPNGFYLNGKKLKLRGLNRHQSYPYVGYAMPKSAQEEDAEILKNQLGVNIVRLSHYPQSKHFVRKCDELGLLVFCEIPGWQHIGDAEWKEHSKNNLREMIVNYFNHPSIILWGVRINESADDDQFYQEMNQIAKTLDDTRATGGVRNFKHSHLFEDVYTYNDFVHSGKNQGLDKRKKVAQKKVPYLVTEHNGHMYPTKKFDPEIKRVEHALRHLRVLNAMYQTEDISGAIGWCMFDYNTHKEFGSGDRICHHGVMDMFRLEKTAFYAYSSQQDKYPVLHVASTFNPGEYDASLLGKVYVFTNCDYIDVYRNEDYLGRFYPDNSEFKYLPHPPIIIDDFFGDLLESEGFAKKDAKKLKTVFKQISQKGKLNIKGLLTMAYIMVKYRLNYQRGAELYTKYVNNWGCEVKYIIIGYQSNQKVCEVIKGDAKERFLEVKTNKDKLIIAETYDVARIQVRLVDIYGNILPYAFDGVKIETSPNLEVIGPKQLALIGGSIAFWVKTKREEGEGEIKVTLAHGATKTLTVPIIKQSNTR